MSAEAFDASWLALREPVDHRSRSVELTSRLGDWWSRHGGGRIVDLGCGTGSNLRYLAPKLPGAQSWILIDRDAELLGLVRSPGEDVAVQTLCTDLRSEGLAEAEHARLVTASALLDLVSAAWLARLAGTCAESGAAALLALTYDGAVDWERGAADADDALVRVAVNEHQRGDKGFGPALGPTATDAALDAFHLRGYDAHIAETPWLLGAPDRELALALVEGWASAASEARESESERIDAWAERKRSVVSSGDFGLRVGHRDLLVVPRERR